MDPAMLPGTFDRQQVSDTRLIYRFSKQSFDRDQIETYIESKHPGHARQTWFDLDDTHKVIVDLVARR